MSSKLLGDSLPTAPAPYVWLATVATPATAFLTAPALMTTAPPKDQPSSAALFIPCWSRATRARERHSENVIDTVLKVIRLAVLQTKSSYASRLQAGSQLLVDARRSVDATSRASHHHHRASRVRGRVQDASHRPFCRRDFYRSLHYYRSLWIRKGHRFCVSVGRSRAPALHPLHRSPRRRCSWTLGRPGTRTRAPLPPAAPAAPSACSLQTGIRPCEGGRWPV